MSDEAGMVEWSPLAAEYASYKGSASGPTTSSFAVRKDAQRDRLISWPRIKCPMMPSPPYVNHPDPGTFSNLRIPHDAAIQAFYLDIENMFYNYRLPRSLIIIILLRPVCLGYLRGTYSDALQPPFVPSEAR